MKLTYRGIQYSEENQHSLAKAAETANNEIIYRGNSRLGKINSNFPWRRYIKQLFDRSESKPIFNPIRFWYDHKREFVRECWHLDDADKLALVWNLTIRIEKAKILKLKQKTKKQKTKLKYRGVSYYR